MGPSSTDTSHYTRTQQEVIIDLSQQALETDDFDQLLHDTTVAVAETLEVEYGGVFELLPEGDEAVLRQGVGWQAGLVGTTVPTGPDSQVGRTLRSEESILIDDLHTDERFSTPAFLADQDISSGLSVRIGSSDDPWGVLGMYTADQQVFTESDADFVQRVASVLESAVEHERTRSELETIYGRISDAFFALDEEWRFTHLNERAHELINPDGRTLIGKRIWDEFPETVSRQFESKYEQAMYEQETVSFEEYYPEPLDTWFEVRAYPSETGLSVYFRDVTERKEREQELEESERRYRTLVEYFPNGAVALVDENLRYQTVGGDPVDVANVTAEEVEGKPVGEVLPSKLAEELVPRYEAALEGESGMFEIELHGQFYQLQVVPVRNDSGTVFGAMGMSWDITEQKERERELKDTKSRLEAATEAGAVGTWELDIQSDEMVISPTFAETFGIDPKMAREGLSLDRFIEALHEDDRDWVKAKIQHTIESCGEYEAEYRVRNTDDEIRWVIARGHVECDANGNPETFPGALTDITERKRAELRLQQNNEQLETLFEILPDGVIVADRNGQLIEANDTAKEIWGGDIFDANSVAEYEQYPAVWIDSNEPVEPEEWTLARVLEGEEVTDPDIFEIKTVDDDDRIIRAKGMPIRDDRGDVTRGVVTISDITERRRSQRKLEESERRYRTLVESYPEGAVGLFDENLEYTAVGGRLVDEVGVDTDDRIGNSVYDIYPDHLIEEIEPYFKAALEGEANSFEVEFHNRHLYARTLPVRNADDEISEGMLVVQDVTERREYERKLEESNERLEQFAYAASHDLQEPLRMVTSYLQLLENRYGDTFDEDGEEFLEFAVDGAKRMSEMIDALLEYSRIETRGDPLEPVDLNTVLEDVIADLQFHIEESDAEITTEELPCVEGDVSQLRQLFQNLLSNALTYSSDEPPRVHVGAERRGQEWVISVRDEGIGIDPEDHERVFTVFDRLHSREEYEGTGIGLALCQRIVERHGGEIWVDSKRGEGATFSFTLAT